MEESNMGAGKSVRYGWVILAVLLIVTLVLQAMAAQTRSFWEDEAVTGQLAATDFSAIIEAMRRADNHPPLYWLLASVWGNIFGVGEQELKSFSILWWIVAWLLGYKITTDLLGRKVAFIVISLFAFSPLALTYAHNARYYSMAAALSLLLVFATYQFANTNRPFYWILYILAGTALLYTMYMGAALLLAVSAWWFLHWARDKQKLSILLAWGMAQGVILIFYIPWLGTSMVTLNRNLPPELAPSNWFTGIALRIGYLGYAFSMGEFISPLNPVLWIGIAATIGLVLLALVKAKPALWLPVGVFGIVGVISIGFNLIALEPQSLWQNLSNRDFFIYPFFVMILAYGIDQLKGKWQLAALLVILLAYGLGIFNYFSDRQALKPILITPWREIMTSIQEKKNTDAVVVCTADYACSYYRDRYGFASHSPADWGQSATQKPPEIWWIQSNLGNRENPNDENALAQVQAQYREADVFHYAPQDYGIAALKSKFLSHQPYLYRVIVYRYVLP